jgi:hypothetical protein
MKSEKTLIANPLYDVVFRYMMEDNKVAKLFLSAIIGEEIEELIFKPTEYSRKIEDKDITVTRMDFSTKIRLENGDYRLILIELQKSKYFFQIMRFRRYLGKQYQNPENFYTVAEREEKYGLPIYPIYILGEAFTEEKIPVIQVRRDYIDAATQEKILEKYPFIEALTHDATVIQIPYLKENRWTVLEQFLEIFDQTKKSDETGHFLEINEEDYPERYHEIIRRLRKAIANPQIESDMDFEDDVFEAFNKQENKLAKAEEEKRQAENVNIQVIQNLAKAGFSIEKIVELTGMEIEKIKTILK